MLWYKRQNKKNNLSSRFSIAAGTFDIELLTENLLLLILFYFLLSNAHVVVEYTKKKNQLEQVFNY